MLDRKMTIGGKEEADRKGQNKEPGRKIWVGSE